MRELTRRFLALFRRGAMDRDMERELQFHIEMKTEETRDAGEARRAVGSALAWREKGRDIWGWTHLDEFLRDARYAVRWLAKSPGFAAAAILTLALGIGANTLVFSVVDATVLRPLPFRDPEKLMVLSSESSGDRGPMQPPFPTYQEWKRSNQAFEELGAFLPTFFDWVRGEYPERILGFRATASLFPTLGVKAALGRTLLSEDEDPGQENVVVLSDRLWRTRFDASRDVVGSTIQIRQNDAVRSYAIIGVLPPGSRESFYGASDLWAPIQPDTRLQVTVLGRLKDGVTPVAAAASQSTGQVKMSVASYQDRVAAPNRPTARILSVAVGFVLLIACANVAGLMMARGAERTQELTIRSAIGAGRGRLLRQLLVESLVVGAAGGILGAGIAYSTVGGFKTLLPALMLGAEAVDVNVRALGFTILVTLAASLLFGVFPAIQGSRSQFQMERLTREYGSRRTWIRGTLIVGEIAVALVLVTGAGLMIQSFYRLLLRDLGFDRQNILTIETSIPYQRFAEVGARVNVERGIQERLGALPGVREVAISDARPLAGGYMPIGFKREAGGERLEGSLAGVTPSYFAAIGIPLKQGRVFSERDDLGAPPVAILNEEAARRYWPGENPIGKTVLIRALQLQESKGLKGDVPREIVGIVGNSIGVALRQNFGPIAYVPHAQDTFIGGGFNLALRVEAGIPAANLVPAIRKELAQVDPALAAREVVSMEDAVDRQVAQPRFITAVLAGFAGLALVLTLTGVAGVVAYLVRARTYEFGVRMALGATPSNVLTSLLSYGGRLASAGIVLGLAGSYGLTRILKSLLYEIEPTDPATMAVAPLIMLVAVLGACYVPARRVLRIDPVQSLRQN